MKSRFSGKNFQRTILSSFVFLASSTITTLAINSTNTTEHDYGLETKAVAQKPILATNLYLHKLLLLIRSNINRFFNECFVQENRDFDQEDIFSYALRCADDAIMLLDQIVTDLNKQAFTYNPGIEGDFKRMCNYLKDVSSDAIEPRHLRGQYKQVKKFDQKLKHYCMVRRDFLSKEDLALFNKMTKLNDVLMICLLNDDYLDSSYFEVLTDYVVYRPWEFACMHPILTFTTVAVVIAAVGYFYIYPKWNSYENKNKEFNVQQLHGLQQNRADCGYFAIAHALMLRSAKNENEFNAMKDKAQSDDNFLRPWKEFIQDKRKTHTEKHAQSSRESGIKSGLSGNELDEKVSKDIKNNLVGPDWLSREEVNEIVGNHDLINKVMQKIIPEFNDAQQNPVVVLENVLQPNISEQGEAYKRAQHKAGISRKNVSNNSENDIVVDAFLEQADREKIKQLKESSNPQNVILRLPDHWIAVRVESDESNPHGIRAQIINSMARNVTNDDHVNRLLYACARNT